MVYTGQRGDGGGKGGARRNTHQQNRIGCQQTLSAPTTVRAGSPFIRLDAPAHRQDLLPAYSTPQKT